MANILIFGNSVAHAAYERRGGWLGRLRDFLNEKNLSFQKREDLHSIYNLGVSGNTIEDLVGRFEGEAKARVKEEKETIIILAVGLNDSQFIHSQDGLRFSPEQIQDNLQKLLSLVQRFSSKIIFIGSTPVDENRTTPIPWNIDKFYRNENIKRNNEIIKNLCRENKLYFVEVFEELMKIDYQRLLDDGLHPNSEGHQKIFEIVKHFLIKNKIV